MSQNVLTSDSVDYTQLYKEYDISKNITQPILNKYEYTQCLGMRAQQIAMGSEPLIKLTPDLNDPVLIAKEELRQRKCPFILEKKIGGRSEFWKLEDLAFEDNLF
jgi:DNA-directed RNA polymerase subunit K/omega